MIQTRLAVISMSNERLPDNWDEIIDIYTGKKPRKTLAETLLSLLDPKPIKKEQDKSPMPPPGGGDYDPTGNGQGNAGH